MPPNHFPAPAPRHGKTVRTNENAAAPTEQLPKNSREDRGKRPSRPYPERGPRVSGKKPARHPDVTEQQQNIHRKGLPEKEDVFSGHEDRDEGFLQPGIKPVTELLLATPEKIDTVFVLKGKKGQDTDQILDLCRKAGVRFSLVDESFLTRLWSGRHQGVIARLFASGFMELDEILALAVDEPLPLVVALDQVQDPGNAGALARTLYALGGAGLVVPRHNGVYLGAAAAKIAAGALDKLAVAKVTNLAQALDAALDAGYTVYGANALTASDPEALSESVFSFTPRLPALLVLGSEEAGLRPIIRKRCSAFISIPFAREFDSLNVAQAGAIIISAFASARQRGK